MSQVNIVIYIKKSIYNKHRKNLRQSATHLEKCVELGKTLFLNFESAKGSIVILSRRMIQFAILILQKTAAYKHGSLTSAAVIRTFSHNREETLDSVVEVGAVFLAIAVLLTPLSVKTIHSRGALFKCFTFFKPCIHKLPDTIGLILIFLSCFGNCCRIIEAMFLEQPVACIAPVEDSRLALRETEECFETFVLLILLSLIFLRMSILSK